MDGRERVHGRESKMFFQNGILVYKMPHGQWITTKYEMQDLGKEKRIIANSREVGFEYLGLMQRT